jgi:hypothetical protein
MWWQKNLVMPEEKTCSLRKDLYCHITENLGQYVTSFICGEILSISIPHILNAVVSPTL